MGPAQVRNALLWKMRPFRIKIAWFKTTGGGLCHRDHCGLRVPIMKRLRWALENFIQKESRSTSCSDVKDLVTLGRSLLLD